MAKVSLHSFNVFLTERLTAAAVDIYGFVEKTVTEYQEEVHRVQLENQRLQRLLDLVYKPEIRLHRTDSRQIQLPTPSQDVCAQEQQNQEECFPSEVQEEPVILPFEEELTEPWSESVMTPLCPAYSAVSDNETLTATAGELTQVITVGEHVKYEMPSQDDPPITSSRVSPTHKKKKNMFSCHICSQSFPKKGELKLHIIAHSTKSLPEPPKKGFSCSVCGRISNTNSQMICHMRVHTGEKPFVCFVCGKRYRVKSHVNEHLRTHTGEKPYVCHICGRGFAGSSGLRKHARVRHNESMPFKCMHCSQCFSQLVRLKQHMKTVHKETCSV